MPLANEAMQYRCLCHCGRDRGLSTIRLDLFIHGILLNRLSLSNLSTKDELSVQLPISRDAPSLLDLIVNQGVVMLQVSAEAIRLERRPDQVLVHAVGLGRPVGEAVGVRSNVLLVLGDIVLIDKEQDGSSTGLEARQAVRGGFPLVVGNNLLERGRGNVPETLVLRVEQDNSAGRLRVEC